jgi:uncharacterized protein YggT (Ycf19 family)
MAITMSAALRKFRNRIVGMSSPLPEQIIYPLVKPILAGLKRRFLGPVKPIDFPIMAVGATTFVRS